MAIGKLGATGGVGKHVVDPSLASRRTLPNVDHPAASAPQRVQRQAGMAALCPCPL